MAWLPTSSPTGHPQAGKSLPSPPPLPRFYLSSPHPRLPTLLPSLLPSLPPSLPRYHAPIPELDARRGLRLIRQRHRQQGGEEGKVRIPCYFFPLLPSFLPSFPPSFHWRTWFRCREKASRLLHPSLPPSLPSYLGGRGWCRGRRALGRRVAGTWRRRRSAATTEGGWSRRGEVRSGGREGRREGGRERGVFLAHEGGVDPLPPRRVDGVKGER